MRHRPCLAHCPPAASALRGPLRAAAAVAAVAVAVWLAFALGPFWAAMVATEAAVAAGGVWVLQRRVRYWGWRKPARVGARSHYGERVTVVAALASPPLAIEAPQVACGGHEPPVVLSAVPRSGT